MVLLVSGVLSLGITGEREGDQECSCNAVDLNLFLNQLRFDTQFSSCFYIIHSLLWLCNLSTSGTQVKPQWQQAFTPLKCFWGFLLNPNSLKGPTCAELRASTLTHTHAHTQCWKLTLSIVLKSASNNRDICCIHPFLNDTVIGTNFPYAEHPRWGKVLKLQYAWYVRWYLRVLLMEAIITKSSKRAFCSWGYEEGKRLKQFVDGNEITSAIFLKNKPKEKTPQNKTRTHM